MSTPNKRAGSTRENVKVVARIRPTNQKEIQNGGVSCVKYTNKLIEVSSDDGGGSHNFSFDQIFGPESTQIEVFEFTAVPLITDVLTGYNATIFAYGQTGTGKTHTMEGSIHNDDDKGIIPRSVEALFNGVLEADENIEFTFKVSYVEIYMEKIRDLLDDNRLKTNLNVREDKIKGIYIAGVTEVYVTSHMELLGIMNTGSANRATAATGMNEGSSRSHSVFTITVNQRNLGNNTTTTGKLVLVDLAGSEMVRKSNASGQQLEEAKTINKSLSALGQVINALTSKDEKTHVPYRDSKLTRILQDSLGGNAKTVLIVAVSPSSYNASETVSTLRFGTRAKSIENKVTVNQTRSVEELENLLLRAEKAIDIQSTHIATLTAQMEAFQLAHVGVTAGSASSSSSSSSESAESIAIALAAAKAAEASRVEAEKMLASLQEQINTLSSELEEEKLETSRKDAEMYDLTRILREKESLLGEAGELLQEAQTQYTAQKDKNEQLIQANNDQLNELQALKTQHASEVDKLVYERRECDVVIETLKIETKQLQQEVAEMSGDADNQQGGKAKQRLITNDTVMHTPTASVHTTSAAAAAAGETPTVTSNTDNGSTTPSTSGGMGQLTESMADLMRSSSLNISGSGSGKLTRKSLSASGSGGSGSNMSASGKENMDQEFSLEINNLCTKYSLDTAIITEINELLKIYLQARIQQILSEYEVRIIRDKNIIMDQNRKLQDLSTQRSRLENDLAEQINKYSKLQFDVDAMKGMDGVSKTEYFSNRERANSRSLQQRLEQLVVVHRQLLRKFASMELENGEYRKKIVLRDERIKQLEGSGRGLVSTMRQQAERHVSELSSLREQFQLARAESSLREAAGGSVSFAPGTAAGSAGSGGSGSGMQSNHRFVTSEIRTLRGGQTHTLSEGGGGAATTANENKVVRGKQHKPLPPTPAPSLKSLTQSVDAHSSQFDASTGPGGISSSSNSNNNNQTNYSSFSVNGGAVNTGNHSNNPGTTTPTAAAGNSARKSSNAADFGIPGSSSSGGTPGAAGVGVGVTSPRVVASDGGDGSGSGTPGKEVKKQSVKSSIFSRLLGQN